MNRRKVYLDSKFLGTQIIKCPFCYRDSGHYNHFNHANGVVTFIDGKDNYEAKGDVVRGDVVKIDFCCEESYHCYSIFFGFHKGNMLVWAEKYNGDVELEER